MKHLTTKELINYIESGVIQQVSAEQVLSVIEDMRNTIDQMKDEIEAGGYQEGYRGGVSAARAALEYL